MAALGTAAIKSYADYEQLVGGVETLFKTSADVVTQYANNAYKTAGMSANQYMETVTSFSASLLQSLGGDTEKAAQIGDMAITDMSDNVNKMGSSVESIQNAYQGFAKQNYTMLDNLKLGYGGTKTEMERLLKDAEKISGIKYDISNLSDVYSAIHVIQEEMGIMDTTAKEASTTISGSMGMVKASFSNLLTGIADDSQDFDKLVNSFVDSVSIAAENILPRVEIALTGAGNLIEKLLPVIINRAPKIINNVLPKLVESGANMIRSVVSGLQQNIPEIITGAIAICNTLISTFLEMLPQLLDLGFQVILQIVIGIAQSLPSLAPAIVEVVLKIVETLVENIDLLIESAIALMTGLTEGLINALPILIERLPEIVMAIVETLIQNAPKLLDAAGRIIGMLLEGLFKYLPQLLIMLPQLVAKIVSKLAENAPQLIKAADEFIRSLLDGLFEYLPKLTSKIPEIVSDIKEAFLDMVSGFADIGSAIIDGIWSGLSAGWGWLVDKVKNLAKSLFGGAKEELDVNSPSKKFKWLAQMCVAGWDEGSDGLMNIDPHVNRIRKSFSVMKMNGRNSVPVHGDGRGNISQVININQPVRSPDEMARAIRLESRYWPMK